jgi:hypothetical protein
MPSLLGVLHPNDSHWVLIPDFDDQSFSGKSGGTGKRFQREGAVLRVQQAVQMKSILVVDAQYPLGASRYGAIWTGYRSFFVNTPPAGYWLG